MDVLGIKTRIMTDRNDAKTSLRVDGRRDEAGVGGESGVGGLFSDGQAGRRNVNRTILAQKKLQI